VCEREGRDYDRVVLVAASQGAIIVLKFLQYDSETGRYFQSGNSDVIFADTPLYASHLKNPLAVVTKYARIGPFWNKLFAPIVRLMFRGLKESELPASPDREAIKNHMDAAYCHKPSAIAEQLAAIIRQMHFADGEFSHVGHAVLMQSNVDGLVYGARSRQDIAPLFQRVIHITVEGGHHADFVENPQVWLKYFTDAFSMIGVRQWEGKV